jgi:hypothetical protein
VAGERAGGEVRESDDAPDQGEHDPGVDDAAPGLGQHLHRDDETDDREGHGPRYDQPLPGRVEEAHAERRREDDVEQARVRRQVLRAGDHPRRELLLERLVALGVRREQHPAGEQHEVEGAQHAGLERLDGERGQPHDGLDEQRGDAGDAPDPDQGQARDRRRRGGRGLGQGRDGSGRRHGLGTGTTSQPPLGALAATRPAGPDDAVGHGGRHGAASGGPF